MSPIPGILTVYTHLPSIKIIWIKKDRQNPGIVLTWFSRLENIRGTRVHPWQGGGSRRVWSHDVENVSYLDAPV